MFDKKLVYAIIGGKHLDCGSAELSVNLVLTGGHGSVLLDLCYFWCGGIEALSLESIVKLTKDKSRFFDSPPPNSTPKSKDRSLGTPELNNVRGPVRSE
jgi:hypothetical protein